MSTISKQRLCGEDYESVAEPLMAAVDRSLDPSSEWHERREALYDVIRHLPLASFDERAQRLLRRLGVMPQSARAAEAADETEEVTSETAPSAASSDAEDGPVEQGVVEAPAPADAADAGAGDDDTSRFVPVENLSTRHKKAFRCKHCRFAWVERVSALTKRDQRTRRCLCANPVLPHKYYCTRSAKVDLKNIQALLKYTGAVDWRVDTTTDEFKNSRITIRLKHKQTKSVQTVVLRPLLAGTTKLG